MRMTQTQAQDDVLAERQRQVATEGYDASHDDEHDLGELALAASYYAITAAAGLLPWPTPELHSNRAALQLKADFLWPWDPKERKPKSGREDLVRAAALLIAEIERRDRAADAATGG